MPTRLQAFEKRVREVLGLRFQALPDGSPIAKLVDLILEDAIQKQATAIRFTYSEKDFAVAFLIGGTFYEVMKPPRKLHESMYRHLALRGNYRNRRGPQRCSFDREGVRRARFDFDFALPLTLGEIAVTVLA